VEERKRARSVPTLADCFDRWLELHAKPHRRTWPDSVRQFNKYLSDFHGRRLSTITEANVSEWHGRIGRDHGPVQANRVLNLLSTLFHFAPKVGFDGANPCRSTSRFREVSRSRFLGTAEMGRFFQAVQTLEPVWRDYFVTLLFTGQRRSTVAAMTWEQLDLQGCTWSIERTKNDQPLTVPLVPFVVNLLQARYEARGDSQWVFAGSRGHIVDARNAWAKVLKQSGISNLTLHDLRRSCGSWQAALGSSLAIIGASLGHKDLKSTQIYSRLDLQPIAQSVGRAVDAMLAAGGQAKLLTAENGGEHGRT
jgi:integrase